MALLVVALVAQQRHRAGELAGELLWQRLLGGEETIEVLEEPIMAAVLAQPMADVARGTQLGLMAIVDADTGQVLTQGGLGEPLAS